MQKSKWLSCLMSAALSFAAAWAAVGCVITAFSLSEWADMVLLTAVLALWSLSVSVLFSLPHGGKWLLGIAVLLAGYALREGTVLRQLEALIYRITAVYDQGYDWGVLSWSGRNLERVSVTWGLILVGGLCATAISRTVCRSKSLIPALLGGSLPLAACCVVTDTVPEAGYVALLMCVLALLLLTQSVRRRRQAEGLRLTALLLIPALLLTWGLFSYVPKDGYQDRSATFEQLADQLLQKIPFLGQGDVSAEPIVPVQTAVDLTSVGPLDRGGRAVMDVVAPISGPLYLRGQAFDYYDGISWSVSQGHDSDDPFWPVAGMQNVGDVEISTRSTHGLRYCPYYANGMMGWQKNGINMLQQNPTEQVTYTFEMWQEFPETVPIQMVSRAVSIEQAEAYLQLPVQTQYMAWKILSHLMLDEMSEAEKILAIRDYVCNSATYSLATSPMPVGETDFAIWFLQSSDTGYCTHFATAAVVLLRSAGIPARYVTGYMAEAVADRRVTVSAKQAHAWVEYLDEDLCWKVLEPTPEDPNAAPSPTVDTNDPSEETTAPSEETTTPSQETTATTQTTDDPTSGTTAATAGSTGASRPLPKDEQTNDLWPVLKVVLWISAGAAAIIGQYVLRVALRKKRMYDGSNNRKAVYRWHYARKLGKLLKCEPPEELAALAEKAVFSQHTLSAAELAVFDRWIMAAMEGLRKKPYLVRLYLRLIFAIG